ncbi:hypothetical protein D3C81_1172810 [compost metagenome]
MAPGPPKAMLSASETSSTSSGGRRMAWAPPRTRARTEGAVSSTGSTSTLVENCSLNQASQVARKDCSNQGAAMTAAMLAATMAAAAQAANTLSTPCGVRMRRCSRGKRDSSCQSVTTTARLHRLNHRAGTQALPHNRSAPTMASHTRLKPVRVAWRG